MGNHSIEINLQIVIIKIRLIIFAIVRFCKSYSTPMIYHRYHSSTISLESLYEYLIPRKYEYQKLARATSGRSFVASNQSHV